ncbi:MAG: Na+/H+ antiporter NhaA [Hyphomicrobium sp.]|nr:Na+/H+ antiporter NhaA [Hyphomicrobium sp.]
MAKTTGPTALKGALAFIQHEAAGGVILFSAAALALLIANSPLADLYARLLDTHLTIKVGNWGLDKNLLHWINDGLMAIFFFLVGLEIKRELMTGELSTPKQAALPFLAAIGGMAVPAIIYALINRDNLDAMRGWAIPAATDIAFAVGVMALLGSRVPSALKVFLLALAILDDLGAIIVIALFYTSDLSVVSLTLAAVGLAVLAALNVSGVVRLAPYIVIGILVWLFVVKSGVHATLAGVATAFAIPSDLRTKYSAAGGMASSDDLMHELHPWVTFLVLPLFAFANAGVSLIGVTLETIAGSIPLGIAAGLIVGKPVGILLMSWIAVASRVAALPAGVAWIHMLGAGMLAGIGFTMSLFIGTLAFPDPAYAADVRIGVLGGSLISATLGYLLLANLAPPAPRVKTPH